MIDLDAIRQRLESEYAGHYLVKMQTDVCELLAEVDARGVTIAELRAENGRLRHDLATSAPGADWTTGEL